MLGVLEKITSTHNNLRTNTVKGAFPNKPTLGSSFVIYGKGLEFGCRVVTTTEVESVLEQSEDSITFKTANSTYKLNYIKDEKSSEFF